MDTEHERAWYALNQQMPDMNHGFLIHTSYGDIDISAEEASPVVQAVRKILEQRLSSQADQSVSRYELTLGE